MVFPIKSSSVLAWIPDTFDSRRSPSTPTLYTISFGNELPSPLITRLVVEIPELISNLLRIGRTWAERFRGKAPCRSPEIVYPLNPGMANWDLGSRPSGPYTRKLSCGAPSLQLGFRPVYAGVYASKQCSRSPDAAKLKNRTHRGTCRSFERAARMLVESNLRLPQDS